MWIGNTTVKCKKSLPLLFFEYVLQVFCSLSQKAAKKREIAKKNVKELWSNWTDPWQKCSRNRETNVEKMWQKCKKTSMQRSVWRRTGHALAETFRHWLQQESQIFYSLQIHIILGTIFLQFPFTHYLQLKIQNNYFGIPSPYLNPNVTSLWFVNVGDIFCFSNVCTSNRMLVWCRREVMAVW